MYETIYEEEIKNSIAIARTSTFTVFVTYMYECGYGINVKENGKWSYTEEPTAVGMMKTFSKLAREHNVKYCLVKPVYLDIAELEKIDRKRNEYLEQEAYDLAMMESAYSGYDAPLARFESRYGDMY